MATIQYCVAGVIATITLTLFLADGREPEMAPREYLAHNLGLPGEALDWLVPLLYVLLALTVVAWVGMRLSSASRRGRALLVFTAGITLIVAASGFLLSRAVGGLQQAGVSTAITLLLCAMVIVAAGALLPSIEDWIGARRELRLIEPLRREMDRRHPDIGIGVRPRGPLVFRVAERLSLISDALYLESLLAQRSAAIAAPGAADHERGEDPGRDPERRRESGEFGRHQRSPSTLRMAGSRASMLSASLNCTNARRRLWPG
jgi:hypothetical protein